MSKYVNDILARYWLANYMHMKRCCLCGNSGIIDTRSTVVTGKLSWCICPNGRRIKDSENGREPTQDDIDAHPERNAHGRGGNSGHELPFDDRIDF